MTIFLHKDFKRGYKKLTTPQKKKFKERRDLFLKNQFSSSLNNHALIGKYKGYRSFNVTGDLRVIFKVQEDIIIFVKVDSHSNLYR